MKKSIQKKPGLVRTTVQRHKLWYTVWVPVLIVLLVLIILGHA